MQTPEIVKFQVADKAYRAELYRPDHVTGTRPGIVVFHGGDGLSDPIRKRAEALAASGYIVLVPDLFGQSFSDRREALVFISWLAAETSRLREILKAAVAALGRTSGVDPDQLAAVGFCFGGMAALELARSGGDVRCAVSIHGTLGTAQPAAPGDMQAAILICTGSEDPFCPPDQREVFEAEMRAADANWRLIIYGGAMHGFSHASAGIPGCAYHEGADRESWRATITFLDDHLQS
jgi:dienelactone hydrolase